MTLLSFSHGVNCWRVAYFKDNEKYAIQNKNQSQESWHVINEFDDERDARVFLMGFIVGYLKYNTLIKGVQYV